MGRRVAGPAPLLLVALFSCAGVMVLAQENVVSPTGRNTTQPVLQSYVAIMGQVARPGVYEVRHTAVELTELVRMGGGLANQASGNLRIIRRGRGGQQVFFTHQLRYPLADGDLIVADPKGFINHRGLPGSSSHRVVGMEDIQANSAEIAPAGVEIGLVQLVGRPVVLDVPTGRATLAGTLDLLNQSLSGNSVVTLLRPNGSRQDVSGDDAAKTPLSSGTVLVFDPRSIDVRTLPRLPAVIRPTNTETNPPATLSDLDRERLSKPHSSADISNAPSGVAAFPANNGADRVAVPDLLPTASVPAATSAFVPRMEQPGEAKPELTGAINEGLNTDLTVDDLPDPSRSADSADRTEFPSKSTLPAPLLRNNSSAFPSAGMTVPFLVIGGVFVLVLAVLRSMARPSNAPPPATLPIPTRRAWSLNDLIENRIPIAEEPLPFPAEFLVHGPVPAHERQLRADGAQSTSRPHLLDQARKPARSSTVRARATPIVQQRPARKTSAVSVPPIDPVPSRDAPVPEKTPTAAQESAQTPRGPRRVDRAFLSLNGGRS